MAGPAAGRSLWPCRIGRPPRGIVLFVGLALLLALSLAALATAQTTTLELRMAANAAAAEQALFAAEAAVREAEWWLGGHGADPTAVFPGGGRFAGVGYGDQDPWQRPGVWRSAPALGVALPAVSPQPRYLIEWLGSFTDGGTRSQPLPPATIDLFRVTAEGGGGSVLLQTTFGQVRGGGNRRFTGRLSWMRVR